MRWELNTKGKIMKFRLCIFLFSTAFYSLLFADLPDEINYEPYKREYNILEQQVSDINSQLDKFVSDKGILLTQESQLEKFIIDLASANADLERRIRDNRSQISYLSGMIRQQEDSLNNLSVRKNRLEARMRRLNEQINTEEVKLRPLRVRLQRLEEKVQQARSELNKAKNELNRVREISMGIKSELEKLQNLSSQTIGEIKRFDDELISTNLDIEKRKQSIEEATALIKVRKEQLESERSSAQKLELENNKLKDELNRLRQVDANHPQIKEVKEKIASKGKEIGEQKIKFEKAKVSLANATSKSQTLEKKLTEIQNVRDSLSQKLVIKRKSLVSINNQTSVKKGEFEIANTKREEKRNEVQGLMSAFDEVVSRKNQVEANLRTASIIQDDFIRDLNLVKENYRLTTIDIDQLYANNRNAISEMEFLRDQIPSFENTMRSNDFERERSERNLNATKNEINKILIEISELESTYHDVIKRRDAKYAEYSRRESLYQDKLALAQNIGIEQASAADKVAETDSEYYARSKASALGKELGKDLSKYQADYWASIRAEIYGHNEGYNIGYASVEESSRGESEGKLAGNQEAYDFADSVLKPKFFEEIFNAKVSSQKIKSIHHLASEDDIFVLEESRTKMKEQFENEVLGISPVSQVEIEKSLSTKTALDSLIQNSKQNLEQLSVQVSDMQKPQNVYQAPNVPYGIENCNSVYKQINVFRQACKQAYLESFKQRYTSLHYNVFMDRYPELFSVALEEERSSGISTFYDRAYNKNYPIAYENGLSDGKTSIFDESFQHAKVIEYNAALPSARNKALGEAKYEVDEWVSQNATLVLQKSSFSEGQLKGGSLTNLELILKNISPVDLKKPVKIIIDRLTNFESENSEYFIDSAKGLEITKFNKIMLKVKDNVRSNQALSVTGRILFSGGKYQSQREEVFQLNAMSAINPALNSNPEYLTNPRIVTRFRSRTIVHSLDINITPLVEEIKSGYTINLSIVDENEKNILLKNTSATTGPLKLNQTKKVSFDYTFLLAGKGSTIKLKLTYLYQGTVIKNEIIEVTPF